MTAVPLPQFLMFGSLKAINLMGTGHGRSPRQGRWKGSQKGKWYNSISIKNTLEKTELEVYPL